MKNNIINLSGLSVLYKTTKERKILILIPISIFSAYAYLFLHDTVGIKTFYFLYPIFDLLFAAILALLISTIISINYIIIKNRKNANKKNTLGAVILSLVSTPFCCNVLIPLFISFLFGSAALSPIYINTQNLLVEYDPLIIIISIVIIYIFYRRSIRTLISCKIRLK